LTGNPWLTFLQRRGDSGMEQVVDGTIGRTIRIRGKPGAWWPLSICLCGTPCWVKISFTSLQALPQIIDRFGVACLI